ncbi:MAG: lysylphosphatidylglycerol synthase domain-containing protein [Acetobacteraceae bacterium]
MKKLSLVLALLGLAAGTALIGWTGAGAVVAAVLSAGWPRFGLYVGWQWMMFVPLGLAWDTIARGRGVRRSFVFLGGRMVRDAASNCLPFSQLGGFVAGARAAMLGGIGWPLATASTVLDVTAEFMAQVAFAAIGLGIVVLHDPGSHVRLPIEIGLACAVVAAAVFIWMQRGADSLVARISGRIAGGRFGGARERLGLLGQELTALHRHNGRFAVSFALHLLGWMMSGVGTFIAYRALGTQAPFEVALAIEALLSAIAAATFLVPAGIGVQEASYAGLGAVFGLPVEVSLAVSLLRRARDLSVGVPILLVWQGLELRWLRQGYAAAGPQGPEVPPPARTQVKNSKGRPLARARAVAPPFGRAVAEPPAAHTDRSDP